MRRCPVGSRDAVSEARARGRTRTTVRKRRPLWDRWRLWVKVKRDGRVLADSVRAAPLLLGRVELIGEDWRSRTPNGGWFEQKFKNRLDAVERLLQHMVELGRG